MSIKAEKKLTELTEEQQLELDTAFEKARNAMKIIESYSQEKLDRLCQAVAWAVSNKKPLQD